MRISKLGVSCVLVAIGVAPLGCETPSTGDGLQSPDAGMSVTPDGGPDVDPPVQSECVPPTKGPTMHGGGSSSDGDETWTADGSPHILPYDTTIYKTVTVEPCAEVLLADGRQVTVRGKLVAQGSATKRIHFGAKDAGKPFANIRSLGAPITLAYATIDGGGFPGNSPLYLAGTIQLQGDTLKPVQELLSVDHVTIDGSKSSGLVLADNAGFAAGSTALVVKNAASHPLTIFARAVGGIPVGSYTGNAKDQILLPTTSNNETINETTTLHDRGVPYLVGHATSDGSLRVDSTAGKPDATLTIEPGVTMRFKKGGSLHVAYASTPNPARGSLIAVGTAAKPIVFTSDEAAPAAGDWLGLVFGDLPTATSKVDYARVEYAGGTTVTGSGSCPYPGQGNNEGAIRITGAPPSQFVTNTVISDSANHAFDRGWRSDNPLIDFLPTNTFTNIGRCKETFAPSAGNVCPDPVPCPQ